MPKQLKDILAGVKSSKIVPGSTGSDPGVDYAPKAPNEQEFVKKHSTEKHDDRVGNDDDVYQATNIKHSQVAEKKHGYKKPEDKAVYATESKKVGDEVDVNPSKTNPDFKSKATVKFVGKGYSIAKDKSGKQYTIKHEEAKCNMTEEGVACPVHEMSDCSKQKKTLREVAKNPYAIGMAAAMKQTGDKPPLKKSTIVKGHEIAKAVKEEAEQLDEVNHREYGAQGKMHPDMARGMKVGQHSDFFQHGTGDKAYGEVTKNDGKAVHLKVKNKTHKFTVTSRLSEETLEENHDDESAEMAKTQLRALANKALHLAMQLNDDQIVEPWVQAKIAVAKEQVTAVHDYMLYGDQKKETEKEQTAPYDGGIDMTGAPRNTYPSFSVDVNTGTNV